MASLDTKLCFLPKTSSSCQVCLKYEARYDKYGILIISIHHLCKILNSPIIQADYTTLRSRKELQYLQFNGAFTSFQYSNIPISPSNSTVNFTESVPSQNKYPATQNLKVLCAPTLISVFIFQNMRVNTSENIVTTFPR